MGRPGRDPGDPVGGNDPGAAFGVYGQDAADRVHQVSARVGMRRAGGARGPDVRPAGRPDPGLAGYGHDLAFYRWAAVTFQADSSWHANEDDASGGLCTGGRP